MYLYIDTSADLTVGVLSDEFEWLKLVVDENALASKKVHSMMYELLNEYDQSLSSIMGLIYPAGPGSYTGMRVSHGIAEILNQHQVSIFSFYHFEVPMIVGHKKGTWISNAFKGEIFKYSWEKEKEKIELEKKETFFIDKTMQYFARNTKDYDFSLSTDNIIKSQSSALFPKIVARGEVKEIYYYRSLEQEYSQQ